MLTNYKPKSRFTEKNLETLRTIREGDTISVHTHLEGMLGKVKSINATALVLQVLRPNFELLSETKKIFVSDITSIRRIFQKKGIGSTREEILRNKVLN